MGLSRNKVAVPEGAAGSPPFYGDFQARVCEPVCAPMGRGVPGRGVAGVEDGLLAVRLACRGWGGVVRGMFLGSRVATGPGVVFLGLACVVPDPSGRSVRGVCFRGSVGWCGGGLRTG